MPARPRAVPWRYRLRQLGTVRLLLGLGAFLMSWHIFRLGPVNFTLADAALASCMVLLATRRSLVSRPFGSLTVPFFLGLFLMLGGLLMGSAFNGDPLRWIVIAIQYLFAYMLVPMILMSAERAWLRRCLLYFVIGLALAQVIAIAASFLFTWDQLAPRMGFDFVTGKGRIGAFSGNANWNGALIAYSLPILFNAIHHRQISFVKSVPIFAALVWGLLGSASFTAFSAATLALGLFFLISNPGNLLKFGLPVLLLGTSYVALDLPLPAAFQERVAGAIESGDMDQAGTFVGRKALVEDAWKMANDTILVGVGADMFREVSVYGMPVHVFPLLILTEGGVFALLGLLIMILALCLLCFRAMRIDRDDGAMAAAILLVFIVFNFSLPHMYARLWLGPLFLALGATFGRAPLGAPRHRPVERRLDAPRQPVRRPRR